MNYLIEDLKDLYFEKQKYFETLDETKTFQRKQLKKEINIILLSLNMFIEKENRIDLLENTIRNNKYFCKQKDYKYYEEVAHSVFSLYVLNGQRNTKLRNVLFYPHFYNEMLDRKTQWKKELDDWQLKNYPNLNIQDEKINKLFQEVRDLKLEGLMDCNIDKI